GRQFVNSWAGCVGVHGQDSTTKIKEVSNYLEDLGLSDFVPEGLNEGSLARSAWKIATYDPSRRERCELCGTVCPPPKTKCPHCQPVIPCPTGRNSGCIIP